MKKTLWTLSAIALIGLGAYACGDDECDPAECATGQECITNLLGDTACGWPCGSDCAAEGKECVRSVNQCMAPCDEGQTRGTDGLCISGTVKDECTTKAECEENQDCINGVCTDLEDGGEKVYKYVRIDDLSATSKDLEDPGADIDSIVLIKKGTNQQVLPSEVVYFERADGTRKNPDKKSVAADPDIVKSITSFKGYPSSTDECQYKENDEYTFVSLGGKEGDKAGLLIVEMGASIEAGDKLDVLELGDCKLSDVKQTSKATADEIKISVSVSDSVDGNWQVVVASGKAQKGIISATIDASMVPAVQ